VILTALTTCRTPLNAQLAEFVPSDMSTFAFPAGRAGTSNTTFVPLFETIVADAGVPPVTLVSVTSLTHESEPDPVAVILVPGAPLFGEKLSVVELAAAVAAGTQAARATTATANAISMQRRNHGRARRANAAGDEYTGADSTD
jgi:hypothetical protein